MSGAFWTFGEEYNGKWKASFIYLPYKKAISPANARLFLPYKKE